MVLLVLYHDGYQYILLMELRFWRLVHSTYVEKFRFHFFSLWYIVPPPPAAAGTRYQYLLVPTSSRYQQVVSRLEVPAAVPKAFPSLIMMHFHEYIMVHVHTLANKDNRIISFFLEQQSNWQRVYYYLRY
jgi:hypothetical protein